MKEMYVQQEELSTMVNSLDKKLETYQKLEKGDILDPPEVVQTSLKEPEVQTVEVGGVPLMELKFMNFSYLIKFAEYGDLNEVVHWNYTLNTAEMSE